MFSDVSRHAMEIYSVLQIFLNCSFFFFYSYVNLTTAAAYRRVQGKNILYFLKSSIYQFFKEFYLNKCKQILNFSIGILMTCPNGFCMGCRLLDEFDRILIMSKYLIQLIYLSFTCVFVIVL